jgi:hypothetical protein
MRAGVEAIAFQPNELEVGSQVPGKATCPPGIHNVNSGYVPAL